MRRSLFISILAAALLATGCKKEEEPKAPVTPPKPSLSQVIEGIWTVDTLSITGQAEFLGTMVNFRGSGINITGSSEFKADKTISSTASCEIAVVLVLPTGEVPSPLGNIPLENLFDGGTYEVISDTELSLTLDGQTQSATVTDYSSTSMTFETTAQDPDTGTDFDLKVTLKK